MNRLVEEPARLFASATQAIGERARRIPGVAVVWQTLQAYGEDRASILAAALSYYTILSLFPVMLFILALTSPFLQSDQAVLEVSRFIGMYLPSGATLFRDSLQEVTKLRGTITLVAAGGFLWSASGVFDLLQLGINRAFCVQQLRPIWRQRAVSLTMVIVVSLLFGLSLSLTTALRLAVHYGILPRHNPLVDLFPPIATLLIGILVFGALYRYVPFDKSVRWRDVWLSAVLASLLWEVAKWTFAWYLTNIALLNLVYGSLGTIIAVMLWGYITAVILLMGAELASVLSGARKRNCTTVEQRAPFTPIPGK